MYTVLNELDCNVWFLTTIWCQVPVASVSSLIPFTERAVQEKILSLLSDFIVIIFAQELLVNERW